MMAGVQISAVHSIECAQIGTHLLPSDLVSCYHYKVGK